MNNETNLNIYKACVDFCETNKIMDYFVEVPLISYINREEFLKLLEQKS